MSLKPPPEPASRATPPAVPERFRVAPATLLMDRFMNQFIKFGGVSVILAVFAIFVFILIQILPLFREARVNELRTVPLEPGSYRILGIDEWSALPFLVQGDGDVLFVDVIGDRGVRKQSFSFAPVHGVGAVRYLQPAQRLAVGTRDGQFSIVDIAYQQEHAVGRPPAVTASLRESPLFEIGRRGAPVVDIGYADAGSRKLAIAVQEHEGRRELHAVTLAQKRSLLGRGEVTVDERFDLSGLIDGTVMGVRVAAQADSLVVSTEEGEVFYLFYDGGAFQVRQRFRPFADQADPAIALMDFVFGDVTLVLGSMTGELRGYSLYHHPGSNRREFGRTKQFPPLPGPARFYTASVRNKAFLVGGGEQAVLAFSTTESIRWRADLGYEARHAVISGKYDRLVLLDEAARLHFFELDDPHPESNWRAFFGKIWYEGASAPKFEWQSTGGSDDFEPKLSLVPLIIGSLKGTFYALLFAVPIALLAAIYTSQFVRPSVKTIVKPVMEIMASLPSVVLGFLAALWLAPIIDTRVPSVLCVIVALPLTAIVLGWGWGRLPPRLRILIPPGMEFVAFLPTMLVVGGLAWHLGPAVERMLFAVTDPATGERIADFRLWWPRVTDTPFEQRNSLVVGFMMGFAVIPIIFTIAEDSLSNVPQSLRSGSLALGASRWQTAWHIVLPTAAAGIFSALMIGLGRAVGETMIVVMATGNTPIMEWNIFSGMRTLSANIAVELPEAPHHGTLYRALFFGAMVLFVMTFFVNTLAEILRQRIRERFKTVE